INPSEDVENLGRNTLVFESDWDKLPHLRKVAKSRDFDNIMKDVFRCHVDSIPRASLPSRLAQRHEQFRSQCRRIGDRANLPLTHLHRSTGWPTVLPGVKQQHHIAMS